MVQVVCAQAGQDFLVQVGHRDTRALLTAKLSLALLDLHSLQPVMDVAAGLHSSRRHRGGCPLHSLCAVINRRAVLGAH